MIFIHDKGCISRICKELWEINKRKGKYPNWTGDHRRGNPSGLQILAKIFNRDMQVKIILYTPGWQNSKSPSKPCVGRTQTAREYKLVVPFYRTLRQYQVWRQASQDPRFHSRIYIISRPRPTGQIWEIKFYWNTAPPPCYHIVYGYFHATATESNRCNCDHLSHKAKKIYSPAPHTGHVCQPCSGSMFLKL